MKDILWFVEEEFDDVILALGVVEEDEETPVDQPTPLLQSQEVRCVDLGGEEGEEEGERGEENNTPTKAHQSLQSSTLNW